MKRTKIVTGAIILAIAVLFFIVSFSYGYYTRFGPGSGFFPIWINGGLIILATLFIIESIREAPGASTETYPRGKALANILATICSLVIFAVLVPPLGFVVPCSVMLAIMLVFHYKWYIAIPAAIVSSILILVVFQSLLGLRLPVNQFNW